MKNRSVHSVASAFMERADELSTEEYATIHGGGGIVMHLKCIKSAYLFSPIKTIAFGATIWGMARSIGIMVGCSGG